MKRLDLSHLSSGGEILLRIPRCIYLKDQAGDCNGLCRFFLSETTTCGFDQGYALDFSLGKALHQTLTFVEDEDAQLPGETPGTAKTTQLALKNGPSQVRRLQKFAPALEMETCDTCDTVLHDLKCAII